MWVSDHQQWSDKPCYDSLPTHSAFAQTQLKAYCNWNAFSGKHQRNMLLVLIYITLSRMDWWMIFLSNIFSCWCNCTTCQLVNYKQFTNSQADFKPSFCICFGCCSDWIKGMVQIAEEEAHLHLPIQRQHTAQLSVLLATRTHLHHTSNSDCCW